MFSLHKKTAAITGSASGIGKAIAELFARRGATVHLLDRDADGIEKIAETLRAEGCSAQAHACDVADFSAVQAVFSNIGPLHILVNNAGVAHIGTAENTGPEDFERVFSVNVRGVYHCLHAAIPRMREAGGGTILNLASIVAWVGIPDRFAYTMSKGAVAAMTLSVAKDFLKDNIRCNSISPARVHTPFVDGYLAKNYPGREAEMFEKLSKTQPIGRMGTVEEVAALALYLCSDEAAFITGCDYPLDGGFIKLNN
ncbi:MAG TPA: SDR family oxidoreductase [Saprospiraceae bacterium]|nr:SDR family oxidoreductase [Saprospiraceae bacterium]